MMVTQLSRGSRLTSSLEENAMCMVWLMGNCESGEERGVLWAGLLLGVKEGEGTNRLRVFPRFEMFILRTIDARSDIKSSSLDIGSVVSRALNQKEERSTLTVFNKICYIFTNNVVFANEPGWHNRSARETFNLKVGSSSLYVTFIYTIPRRLC